MKFDNKPEPRPWRRRIVDADALRAYLARRVDPLAVQPAVERVLELAGSAERAVEPASWPRYALVASSFRLFKPLEGPCGAHGHKTSRWLAERQRTKERDGVTEGQGEAEE